MHLTPTSLHLHTSRRFLAPERRSVRTLHASSIDPSFPTGDVLSHDHSPNSEKGIRRRKVDHLELCAKEEVEQRLTTTLLEDVHLHHQSLPELDVDAIDTTTTVFGKTLAAPLCISGMTGGAEEARIINRQLATVAQRKGIAFGVGSQRAMLIDPSLLDTYAVRSVAPDILLFANIGIVQASQSSTSELRELVGAIDADALCVHMNPAQEMIQQGGDRDFRGGVQTFARLVEELGIPIIAKETGCGVSPRTAEKLARVGVSWVDVSGAGGTTWVGVEALRARPNRRAIGEDFWEWGVPTAASLVFAKRAGLHAIASGGVRTSLDVARALALGADLCSMALPYLRAARVNGVSGAEDFADRLIEGLKVAMVLTESQNLEALREAPKVIGKSLRHWTTPRS